MPDNPKLLPLSDAEAARIPGLAIRATTAKFPLRTKAKGEVTKGLDAWLKSQKAPEAHSPHDIRVKAQRLSVDHVRSLARIADSGSATATAVHEGYDAERVISTLYASNAAYTWLQLQAEHAKRSKAAITAAAKAKVEKEWADLVRAMQIAHSKAGLAGLTEADLDKGAKELQRDKEAFNRVATVLGTADTAKDRVAVAAVAAPVAIVGMFVPTVAVLPDLATVITNVAAGLCSRPITGTYTKHFSYSFSLRVRIYVPCPRWSNPFAWCWKTFTLASVTFSVDLNVGYKVDCCGATAWGSAAVQACASLLGINFCAACTASIQGVAGIGHQPSGSNCLYGLGVTASLVCTFGGVTVFSASVPFGWTITAPCPPAILPC